MRIEPIVVKFSPALEKQELNEQDMTVTFGQQISAGKKTTTLKHIINKTTETHKYAIKNKYTH